MKKLLSIVLSACLIGVIVIAPSASALSILEFGISDIMQEKLDNSSPDDVLKAAIGLDNPSNYIEQKVKDVLGYNNTDIIGQDRTAVNKYCAENGISFSEAVDVYKQTKRELYSSASQEYGEKFADNYLQKDELLNVEGCTLIIETTVNRLNKLWKNGQVVLMYDYDEYLALDYEPSGTVAIGASPSTSAAEKYASFSDDFIIFANGQFESGGKIADGCGTIIDQNGILVGGDGIRDGKKGKGSFEIQIDSSGNDAAWKEFKYMRVVCANERLGETNLSEYGFGTVQFGAGNIYNFDQIELSGKTVNSLGKLDTFLLDLSKVSKFDKNTLIFSHMFLGYKVEHLALTNHSDYSIPEDMPYDLYISAVGLSASVDEEGQSSAIGATVRNLSDYAISKSVQVDYYVDGKLIDTVYKDITLEQGGTVNIVTEKKYEARFGTHRITAAVRCSGIEETDSDNNIIKARFTISD